MNHLFLRHTDGHHHLNCFWIKMFGCHSNRAPLIIIMEHTNQQIRSLGSGVLP